MSLCKREYARLQVADVVYAGGTAATDEALYSAGEASSRRRCKDVQVLWAMQ